MIYVNEEDERFVLDVVAPGFNKDTVTVKTAMVDGGDTFKLTIEGIYKGHTNKNGDPVPRVAFEKYVEDFKVIISEGIETEGDNFGFNVVDYDLDNLTWSATNGVIRISIPKISEAKGKVIKPVENADADSTGTEE